MALCGSSAKMRIPPAAQRIAIWQMRMTHLVEYTLRSAVFISDIYRKRVLRRYDLAKAIGLDFAGLVHLIEADKHETDVPSGYGLKVKKIDANDLPGVIGEESLPSLGGRLGRLDSVLGDS